MSIPLFLLVLPADGTLSAIDTDDASQPVNGVKHVKAQKRAGLRFSLDTVSFGACPKLMEGRPNFLSTFFKLAKAPCKRYPKKPLFFFAISRTLHGLLYPCTDSWTRGCGPVKKIHGQRLKFTLLCATAKAIFCFFCAIAQETQFD